MSDILRTDPWSRRQMDRHARERTERCSVCHKPFDRTNLIALKAGGKACPECFDGILQKAWTG